MRQNQPGRLHDIFSGGLAIPTPCGDGLDGFQHDDIRSVPVHFRFNSKFDNGAHDIFRNSDAPEFPSGGDDPFGYLVFPFLPCGTEAHRIIFKGRTARHYLKPRFRFRHAPDLHAQTEPVEKLRAEFPFFRVHRSNKYKTGRMRSRNAFSLDRVYAHCRRIQQYVHKMVIQQVDFVHIQDTPVGIRKDPRFETPSAFTEGRFHIQ